MRCTACNEIVGHPTCSILTNDYAWCDVDCLRKTTADLKPLAGAALASSLYDWLLGLPLLVPDHCCSRDVADEIGVLLGFARLYHAQRRKHLRDSPATLELELRREIAAARRPTPPPPKESQR